MSAIGSLFSGIGLLELGLEQAGLGSVAWQCEIDPWCRRVLAKHWPEAERFDDVRTIRPRATDVICGGFPCQPFSLAGKQRGLEDERWLWPDALLRASERRQIMSDIKTFRCLCYDDDGHLAHSDSDVKAVDASAAAVLMSEYTDEDWCGGPVGTWRVIVTEPDGKRYDIRIDRQVTVTYKVASVANLAPRNKVTARPESRA